MNCTDCNTPLDDREAMAFLQRGPFPTPDSSWGAGRVAFDPSSGVACQARSEELTAHRRTAPYPAFSAAMRTHSDFRYVMMDGETSLEDGLSPATGKTSSYGESGVATG